MNEDRPPTTRTARLVVATLVSVLPTNLLRTLLYRYCFGYRIVGAQIGFGTVIAVDRAHLDRCTIGRFNRFVGPMRMHVGPGADIESHNVFDCGDWAGGSSHVPYARELLIEADTRITTHHFFDIAGRFVLGKGSWIAGRASQFWTHGAGATDRDIAIGRYCYVGSAARFAPGSSIADNVIVGIGSTVTRHIVESNAIVAGSPAGVVARNRGWKSPEALAAVARQDARHEQLSEADVHRVGNLSRRDHAQRGSAMAERRRLRRADANSRVSVWTASSTTRPRARVPWRRRT